ncbi:four helix bundle protein [Candidatus Poribacteria bacterium]|nr:four helix bundle protein [Candidatus Poribacteria bacterium]
MGKRERFEDLIVWQKSMDLAVTVYHICQKGALSKDWGLRDQLRRAAISVPANIAEGYERGSRKEYIQFLKIAKGSIGELRCLFQLANRVEHIESQTATPLIENSAEVSRILKAMMRSLEEKKD